VTIVTGTRLRGHPRKDTVMASLKPLWLSVGSLSQRLRNADSLHVGLDFDGTLTPISADSREATLSVRAREVLERLARRAGARLAILSSRMLDDLWRRVGIEGVFCAGSSGLETRDERGRRELHAGAGPALPRLLLRELEGWCQRFPGARLESRGSSCALHFAEVASTLQPAFGAGVRRRLRPHDPQWTLVHGRTGFEVMPVGGWDKAAALERWLESAGPETLLFYFGDDTRDEPVHEAVRRRGGLAVAVDRIVSNAEYALPTPGDVIWFLEWLDREWALRADLPARAGQDRLEPSAT
jgi:trehalose-phosphatase